MPSSPPCKASARWPCGECPQQSLWSTTLRLILVESTNAMETDRQGYLYMVELSTNAEELLRSKHELVQSAGHAASQLSATIDHAVDGVYNITSYVNPSTGACAEESVKATRKRRVNGAPETYVDVSTSLRQTANS